MNKFLITEAIILCGGKGTRLNSVVSDRPKPMADIGGKPFLDILITDLIDKGIKHIILSTGYLSEYIEDYANNWRDKIKLTISREEKPLGTGGAVYHAISHLQTDNYLVLNGDSFIQFNLDDMIKKHRDMNAKITILVSLVNNSSDFGEIKMDEDGLIKAFNEKVIAGPGLVNSGVYLFSLKNFECLNIKKCFSIENDLFPMMADLDLYGYFTDTNFIDIGTPENYRLALNLFSN